LVRQDFVFGGEPCCVDFFLANQLDFVYHTVLQTLQDHTGTDLLASFPKIAGVWKRIRELPSYSQVSYAVREAPSSPPDVPLPRAHFDWPGATCLWSCSGQHHS
jgi:glutathione S-transferase